MRPPGRWTVIGLSVVGGVFGGLAVCVALAAFTEGICRTYERRLLK